MKEECVESCEFLRFNRGKFHCKFYKDNLISKEIDSKVHIFRCNDCEEEGLIGTNTIEENIRKLKERVGLTMDSFYSFKDDIESEVTEIFRILKGMEDKNELE